MVDALVHSECSSNLFACLEMDVRCALPSFPRCFQFLSRYLYNLSRQKRPFYV